MGNKSNRKVVIQHTRGGKYNKTQNLRPGTLRLDSSLRITTEIEPGWPRAELQSKEG